MRYLSMTTTRSMKLLCAMTLLASFAAPAATQANPITLVYDVAFGTDTSHTLVLQYDDAITSSGPSAGQYETDLGAPTMYLTGDLPTLDNPIPLVTPTHTGSVWARDNDWEGTAFLDMHVDQRTAYYGFDAGVSYFDSLSLYRQVTKTADGVATMPTAAEIFAALTNGPLAITRYIGIVPLSDAPATEILQVGIATFRGTELPPPPAVPEPTSMVLLGTGLVGLVVKRLRRC